jgi:hypothetical protein
MKTCNGTIGTMITAMPQQAKDMTINNNTTTNYDQCNVNNGTINNNTIINNNNNLTMNIRCYGEEIIDHITNIFKDARLQEFNGRGIVNMIKCVHFNPEIPENHNIRKYDKNLWKIYDNGDWMFKSFKSAIQDLIKRYKDELCCHLLDSGFESRLNCEVTLQQIMSNFLKFDIDKTPTQFYRCVRDIMDLMENLELQYDRDNNQLLTE